MNFFTHIMISETLYCYLSKDYPLDKIAFRYGNIKPDLSSQCLRNPHTLENCLFLVVTHSNRLLEQNLSLKDFSADLGVICHYICDFFCYYHFDNSLHRKLLRHFLYETRLQLCLYGLLLPRKLHICRCRRKSLTGISSMIMDMRRDYAADKKSPHSDIEYALKAAVRVCDSIIAKRVSAGFVMDQSA